MALHNGGWQAFDDDYSGYFVEDDDANIVAVFQLEADADEYVNLRQRAEAAEAKLKEWETAANNSDPYITNGGYVEVEVLEAVKRRNVELLARAETAEAAALQLRLDLGSAVERSNRLAIWTDRYGADQWRRGNAGKDPQGFSEWQKEAQP